MPFVPCCNCKRSSSPPLPRIRVTKAPATANGNSITIPRASSQRSGRNSINSADRRALDALFGLPGATNNAPRQADSGASTPRLAEQTTPQPDSQHHLSPKRLSLFKDKVKGQISQRSGLSRASIYVADPTPPRSSSLLSPEQNRTKGPPYVDSWAVRRSESGGYDSDAVVLDLPDTFAKLLPDGSGRARSTSNRTTRPEILELMTLANERVSTSSLDYRPRTQSQPNLFKRTGGVYTDSTDGLGNTSNRSLKSTVNGDPSLGMETPAQEIDQYNFALPDIPDHPPVVIEAETRSTHADQDEHGLPTDEVPSLPATPSLEPLRLPSITDSSTLGNWRLSISSPRKISLASEHKTSVSLPFGSQIDEVEESQSHSALYRSGLLDRVSLPFGSQIDEVEESQPHSALYQSGLLDREVGRVHITIATMRQDDQRVSESVYSERGDNQPDEGSRSSSEHARGDHGSHRDSQESASHEQYQPKYKPYRPSAEIQLHIPGGYPVTEASSPMDSDDSGQPSAGSRSSDSHNYYMARASKESFRAGLDGQTSPSLQFAGMYEAALDLAVGGPHETDIIIDRYTPRDEASGDGMLTVPRGQGGETTSGRSVSLGVVWPIRDERESTRLHRASSLPTIGVVLTPRNDVLFSSPSLLGNPRPTSPIGSGYDGSCDVGDQSHGDAELRPAVNQEPVKSAAAADDKQRRDVEPEDRPGIDHNTQPSIGSTKDSLKAHGKSSSLTSWSEFPSDQKFQQSSSAGAEDDVLVRDFAVESKEYNQGRVSTPVTEKAKRYESIAMASKLDNLRSTALPVFSRRDFRQVLWAGALYPSYQSSSDIVEVPVVYRDIKHDINPSSLRRGLARVWGREVRVHEISKSAIQDYEMAELFVCSRTLIGSNRQNEVVQLFDLAKANIDSVSKRWHKINARIELAQVVATSMPQPGQKPHPDYRFLPDTPLGRISYHAGCLVNDLESPESWIRGFPIDRNIYHNELYDKADFLHRQSHRIENLIELSSGDIAEVAKARLRELACSEVFLEDMRKCLVWRVFPILKKTYERYELVKPLQDDDGEFGLGEDQSWYVPVQLDPPPPPPLLPRRAVTTVPPPHPPHPLGKSILDRISRLYKSHSTDHHLPESGHRSSVVATGGVGGGVKHPELEVLAPNSSSRSRHPHTHTHTRSYTDDVELTQLAGKRRASGGIMKSGAGGDGAVEGESEDEGEKTKVVRGEGRGSGSFDTMFETDSQEGVRGSSSRHVDSSSSDVQLG
ncbi:MAG: hypothetical protein M1823_004683 [Watsoniomyces obsoletus]|nr:MAG: hypothetical protein M1823_004683 [Watsoniomyces obsoletus]